jgi:hypothetical protein
MTLLRECTDRSRLCGVVFSIHEFPLIQEEECGVLSLLKVSQCGMCFVMWNYMYIVNQGVIVKE